MKTESFKTFTFLAAGLMVLGVALCSCSTSKTSSPALTEEQKEFNRLQKVYKKGVLAQKSSTFQDASAYINNITAEDCGEDTELWSWIHYMQRCAAFCIEIGVKRDDNVSTCWETVKTLCNWNTVMVAAQQIAKIIKSPADAPKVLQLARDGYDLSSTMDKFNDNDSIVTGRYGK